MESRQKRQMSIRHFGYLRARWFRQVLANIWHFIGRLPDRRRDDHCRYHWIRYAQRPSNGWSSNTDGWRCCCIALACPAHKVCRWTWDYHRSGDAGAVHTPDALPVTAVVAAVVGSVVTFAVLLLAIGLGVCGRPEHAGHGHSLYGGHCSVDGDAVRADGVESFLQSVLKACLFNSCSGRR